MLVESEKTADMEQTSPFVNDQLFVKANQNHRRTAVGFPLKMKKSQLKHQLLNRKQFETFAFEYFFLFFTNS